ncbi:MAG: CotH kinase family protein, partial [Oscillospiraceae bacterium]|nr:CotH kinase family protein [Oscillospiraceae bacterium]
DKFLRRFNELMLKSWTADKVLATIDGYHQELLPEIDQHLARWNIQRSKFDSEMNVIIEYAQERPSKMLYYVMTTYEFSEAEMNSYFADSLAVVVPQALDDIVAKIEKRGLSKCLKEWGMDEDEYSRKLEAVRDLAQSSPVSLLKLIYKVYEPNGDAGTTDYEAFEDVLNAAR